jgi:hypothetical protein
MVHPCETVRKLALNAICSLVSGDTPHKQVVFDNGALPVLRKVLDARKNSVLIKACHAIGHFTASGQRLIQAVCDEHDLVARLVDLAKTADYDVRQAAAIALSNAVRDGTGRQIQDLVSGGCLPVMCSLLAARDSTLVLRMLESIKRILEIDSKMAGLPQSSLAMVVEQCGGLGLLESLQEHESHAVYETAVTILENVRPRSAGALLGDI